MDPEPRRSCPCGSATPNGHWRQSTIPLASRHLRTPTHFRFPADHPVAAPLRQVLTMGDLTMLKTTGQAACGSAGRRHRESAGTSCRRKTTWSPSDHPQSPLPLVAGEKLRASSHALSSSGYLGKESCQLGEEHGSFPLHQSRPLHEQKRLQTTSENPSWDLSVRTDLFLRQKSLVGTRYLTQAWTTGLRG